MLPFRPNPKLGVIGADFGVKLPDPLIICQNKPEPLRTGLSIGGGVYGGGLNFL